MEANAGEYIKNYLHLKRFPRISLHCKVAPVQYWEYEYGLFSTAMQTLDCVENSSNQLQFNQFLQPIKIRVMSKPCLQTLI